MIRFIAAPFLALLMLLGIVVAPAWAGENRGMCKADDSRVQIPDSFPVDACFDGKTLVLVNGTQLPLALRFTGNGVDKPQVYSQGEVDGASALMAALRPGDFSATPQTNGPDVHSGVVPPGYHFKVNVGNDQVSIHLGTADAGAQKMYLIAESAWRYLPVGEATKSVVDFFNEIMRAGDNYLTCHGRSKHVWDDVLCGARLGWDVEFAAGRAVIKGTVVAVVKALISLIETAQWADAASGDLLSLKNGTRDFTIKAYAPPPPPPTTTQAPVPPPPAPNPGSAGDNGGDNSQVPPPAASQPVPPPAPQPVTAAATVQNKHVEGSSALVEDSTPVYLSTSTQPYCASRGCKIDGTDMWSGTVVTAICWVNGDSMTNSNLSDPADDGNPYKQDSSQWMRVAFSDRLGYISFVYLTPDSWNVVQHC